MKLLLSVLAALTLIALPAGAWNGRGHRATAEIAWRQMSQSERRAASELLRQHPHYKLILAEDVPAGVDTNEWVFLTAAVWPDLVRPARPGFPPKPEFVTDYNLHPHGIEIPFLRAGDTNLYLLQQDWVGNRDAEVALSNALATLNNRKASAQQRAVSLCWVLHLTGDLHQPLHTANLISKERPRDLSAGGEYLVHYPKGDQISMHALWDQLPGLDMSYRGVVALANELTADPELKPAALKEFKKNKTITSWVEESHRAAVEIAYDEKRIQFADVEDIRSGKVKVSDLPLVSDAYLREGKTIVHRRLALAALRLTRELKSAF